MKNLFYSLILLSLFYSYFAHSSSKCEKAVSNTSSVSQETELTPEYIKGLSPKEFAHLIVELSNRQSDSDLQAKSFQEARMAISNMTKNQIQSHSNTLDDLFVLGKMLLVFRSWDIWTHKQKVWFLTSKRFKQSIKQRDSFAFFFLREIESKYFTFFTKRLIRSMDSSAIHFLFENENLPGKIIRWITPEKIRPALMSDSIPPSHLQHLTAKQLRNLPDDRKKELEERKFQYSSLVDEVHDEFDSLTDREKSQLSPEYIENLSADQKQELAPTLKQTTLIRLSSEILGQIFSALTPYQKQFIRVWQIKNLNREQKEDIAKDLSPHQIYLLFVISPSTLIDMLEYFPVQQFATAFPLLLLLESEIGDLAQQKIRQTIQTFPINTLMPYYHPRMFSFLNTVQKSIVGEFHHEFIDVRKANTFSALNVEITFNDEGLIIDINNTDNFLHMINLDFIPHVDHLFGRLSVEIKQSLTAEQIEMLSDKNKFLLIRDLTKDQIQSLPGVFFGSLIGGIDAELEKYDTIKTRYDYLTPQQRKWLTPDQQDAIQELINYKSQDTE